MLLYTHAFSFVRRRKLFSPPWRIRAKSLSVASAGVRKPSSGVALGGVLQRLRVGVLAGLHEVVQVEVARDERGGLAARLVQGQGLHPLNVAHNLLEARALIEAVGPKCLHLAPTLVARVAQLGDLAAHGLRQPAHVVQVPLPLLRLPALAQC